MMDKTTIQLYKECAALRKQLEKAEKKYAKR